MPEVDPRDFIKAVWAAQPHEKGYVFVSIKEDDAWRDLPLKMRGGVVRVPTLPAEADVYFCPNVFKEANRKRESALDTVWLHADLDEVDPSTLELPATAAWRTSKGRYQCLWRVTAPLKVKHFEVLNQRLTYLTAADRGGWSVTKVLRVPGTINHKRAKEERVELLWEDMQEYLPKTLVKLVRDVKVVMQAAVEDLELPDITADALYHRYRKSLPNDARRLIMARTARVGQRSERLWQLESLLLTAGIPKEEVLILVRDSVWNKYAGQRREVVQLWTEICKAAHNIERNSAPAVKKRRSHKHATSRNGSHVENDDELPLISCQEFLAKPSPRESWTVESIWSDKAHGLIAGEPKTYKSIISTDLAVSVASGKPFLGEFEVPQTGPVIIIQEENTIATMKDRVEKIMTAKGLITRRDEDVVINGLTARFPGTSMLPLHFMNGENFNLYDDDDISRLEHSLARIKPKLLILDPLYLVAPTLQENDAASVTPILRGLLTLKQRYDVGILIVHHYNKPRESDDRHPGIRISGSSVFYRWFDSAVYLEKGKDPGEVIMTGEHRGHGAPNKTKLEIEIEDEYDVHVEVIQGDGALALKRQILTAVRAQSQGMTLTDLADYLQIENRERVKRAVEKSGCLLKPGKKSSSRGGKPSMVVYPPR